MRPRQPRTTIALFASMAFVAVMLGLLAGRSCDAPKPRAPLASAPAPVVERPAAIDPHAPLTHIEPAVVDAGESLPLVAIAAPRVDPREKARPPRGNPRDDTAHVVDDPEPPTPPPPVIVDAGTPSMVVDAGVARVASTPAERAPDALPSAPLVVMYRDELTWLKIVEMRVFLNGKRVVDDKPSDGNRPARGERKLFETRVFPGHHQVRIETTYVGEDSGIFAYMNDVRVRMREMIVVEVDATKGARVLAHAFDRGALEPWEKRPGLKLTQR
jgi:hypothetical protein